MSKQEQPIVPAVGPFAGGETSGQRAVVRRTLLLLVLLGLSLALNVVLGWQVRSYKIHKHIAIDPPALGEGALVTEFTAKTLDGVEEKISFTGTEKATVLYVFSLTCVWSTRNTDRVRALAHATASTHRFVGLSLRDEDTMRLDLERQKLGFPVFKALSRDTITKLGLGSTPHTLVVSNQSRLIKNWVGAYGGDLKKEIESYFRVPVLEAAVSEQATTAMESPQSCTRCVLDGLFYSAGAVVTNAGRKLRCGPDGRWVEF